MYEHEGVDERNVIWYRDAIVYIVNHLNQQPLGHHTLFPLSTLSDSRLSLDQLLEMVMCRKHRLDSTSTGRHQNIWKTLWPYGFTMVQRVSFSVFPCVFPFKYELFVYEHEGVDERKANWFRDAIVKSTILEISLNQQPLGHHTISRLSTLSDSRLSLDQLLEMVMCRKHRLDSTSTGWASKYNHGPEMSRRFQCISICYPIWVWVICVWTWGGGWEESHLI